MKDSTDLGTNRTGFGAPRGEKRMAENSWVPAEAPVSGTLALAKLRAAYAEQSGPLGSVPTSTANRGRKPSLFIDKLGERLAFERSGARLYEGLIGKYESEASPRGPVDLEILHRFHEDELRHFQLAWESLEKLGADPTAVTPSADLVGVKTQGFIQAMSDPRTTFAQGLDVILGVELADNDGWRLLVDLARGMNQDDMADSFSLALREEESHLEHARRWLRELYRKEFLS